MRLLCLVVLTVLSITAAQADIVRSAEAWTVTPDFKKNADAREALSGAACATGTNHCFAVNDEKKYAQFFDIVDRNVTPTELIRLLPDELDGVELDEIDAEGVAYTAAATAGGVSYFYVIGSHGLSQNGGVAAVPLLPAALSGRPGHGASDLRVRRQRAGAGSIEDPPFARGDQERGGSERPRRAEAGSQWSDDRGNSDQR